MNQYLTLIFSDCSDSNHLRPSKSFVPVGIAGFCHVEMAYLQTLPLLAKKLQRTAVFPPTWTSLENRHNYFKRTVFEWNHYLDLSAIQNVEQNPPFSFDKNGDIITDLTVSYYSSKTSMDELLKNESDILVLVNYNGDNILIYDGLFFPERYVDLHNYNKYRYNVSEKLKMYANHVISHFMNNKFAFIHIRRGDGLYNPSICEPNGTHYITSSKYVSKFIKRFVHIKTIIVSTNESSTKYKEELTLQLSHKHLVFEENLHKYLPSEIAEDNYSMYLILHEIAKKATINIGTCGYVRMGNKYDMCLNMDFNGKIFS